jgi:hypothetical protein
MKSEVPLGGESVLFLSIEQYLKKKIKINDLDNPKNSGQYVFVNGLGKKLDGRDKHIVRNFWDCRDH